MYVINHQLVGVDDPINCLGVNGNNREGPEGVVHLPVCAGISVRFTVGDRLEIRQATRAVSVGVKSGIINRHVGYRCSGLGNEEIGDISEVGDHFINNNRGICLVRHFGECSTVLTAFLRVDLGLLLSYYVSE